MAELNNDLNKLLSDFQLICSKCYDTECSNKELSSMLSHLKHVNEILKENDKKCMEQIKTLRHVCNEQVKTIAELHGFRRQNEILTEENINLQNILNDMKDKITAIGIKNDETIQECIFKHKLELEDKKEKFNNRERELQDKIEGLQASFDLEIYEKENEKKNIKINFDDQLKKAADKEQQLKNEIFKLNNQLSSNTAVLQKKILELEQKLKTAEREKSIFNISQGNFINANVANNVLKNYSNANQMNRNSNDGNYENQAQSRNFIVRNEVRNVSHNIENNTAKKFQFRKSNRPTNENVEKRLLSESFNPFEMNKQMNANNQPSKENNNSSRPNITTNSSNYDITYDIIEDCSENCISSLQDYKSEEINRSENVIYNKEIKTVQLSQENNSTRVSPIEKLSQKDISKRVSPISQLSRSKRISPNVKKRRLFNPNNIEYLN